MSRARSESMIIKNFGSTKADRLLCNIVELKILTKASKPLNITVVVVSHIRDHVHVPPVTAANIYQHLARLELADSADCSGELKIDILIGLTTKLAFIAMLLLSKIYSILHYRLCANRTRDPIYARKFENRRCSK